MNLDEQELTEQLEQKTQRLINLETQLKFLTLENLPQPFGQYTQHGLTNELTNELIKPLNKKPKKGEPKK